MPGGSTRSVLDVQPFAFRVARASGSRLWDVDGHEYVDLLGDYSAGLFGHDHAVVAGAVTEALNTGWSYGGLHTDEVRFAAAVCDAFPSIERVRFTNSGSEANLMAVQVARHHTGRETVAVAHGAYHGGFMVFAPGPDPLRAPFPYELLTFNDLDSLAAITSATAAVLIEPMMGAGGCIPATPEFLAGLRRRCDETGAVLIFDEVMTSRMHVGGVQARLGVIPDMTTLGKYLAGGMTFGAFGGRAEIMDAFDPEAGGPLRHGGTFNNNVVTMAAGAAVMAELRRAAVLDELFARGESLRGRIEALAERSPIPLSVSGMGSLMAIHTVRGPVTTAPVADDPVLQELIWHGLVERGFYVAARGYLALSTAITDDDCEAFVDALSEVVEELAGLA